MLNPGSKIQDPESRVQDPGFGIQNSGSKILDPGSRLLDPESRILNPGSCIELYSFVLITIFCPIRHHGPRVERAVGRSVGRVQVIG